MQPGFQRVGTNQRDSTLVPSLVAGYKEAPTMTRLWGKEDVNSGYNGNNLHQLW